MENLFKDLGFGFRLLARNPGFTAVAVLSLALGIGINTAMFSVVNAVMFAPTNVAEPERLTEIYMTATPEMPYLTTSYPDFLDLQASADAFSGMAGHALVRAIYRRPGDRAELVLGEVVTERYFDVLGVRPRLGRAFLPEENRTELTHPVAVVSHGFWKRRLAGDPAAVGREVELSGTPYTIVGIGPEGFEGTIPGLVPEFWTPVMMTERLTFQGIQTESPSPGKTRLERRGSRWLFVTARLAPGRTAGEAKAQVETIVARLAADHPEVNEGLQGTLLPARQVRLHPMVDKILGPAAAVLMGAVGLVLLIACANVANLLLARTQARGREMAVRLAIGASRGRILRQLLAESLVLAVLGGSLGVLFAVWAGRLLSSAQLPLPVPLAFDYALDGRVLAFAILASFLTTTLFGLAPALQAAKSELVGALRGEAGVLGGRARRFHLRDVLVGGQLALSVVLLVAGALLLRALFEASHIRPGFEPDRLAILSFNLKMNGYTKEQTEALHKRVTERLRSVPGAEEVALVSRAPLGSDINMEGIRIKGHHDPEGQPTTIDATYVEPAYFPALGLRAVDGRLLTEADGEGKPGVVVINEAMARRYWPDRSAVGERVYTEGFDGPSFEVVGVVADYKVRGLGEDPRPYLHFAWRQRPSQSTTLLVRSATTGAPLLAGLKAAVLELEPAVVFTEEGTVADLLRLTLAPTRVGALLLAAFGGLALLLASIGLYGVVAQSVAQRTREIGVRVALGADARSVLRTVLGRGMRLASAGALAGLLAAAVLTRTLSSLLYGVSAVDPLAYLAAVLVLLAVAALANFIPARRAARVDPMVALRHE